MPAQPLLAAAGKEEIFREVEFVAFADLNGSCFDESSALECVHGVADERSGVAGAHLEAQIAGA